MHRPGLAMWLAVLLALLAACPGRPAQSPDTQTPDSNGEPLPPVPCEKDSDCKPPACGPCTPGAVLLQQVQECVVNPCPNVKVVCSAQRMCVVQ
jgi:hypothetical protein